MTRFRLSDVALYGISVILVSGSNFISAPLLLKAMGPEEFSRWALMEPILLALIPLTGFGIEVGLLQKLSTQPEQASRILSELFPYYLACAGLVALGGFAVFVNVSDVSQMLAAVCGVIMFGEGCLLLFLAYWRAQNKPAYFVAVDGVRSFTLMTAVFIASVMITKSQFTVETYVSLRLGFALAGLVAACLLVRPAWRPGKALAISAIRYGLPITIASFLSNLFLTVDRYAVDRFAGALELTSYVAHTRLAQLLPMAVMAPFFMWFAPRAMRAVAERGAVLAEAATITLIYVAVLCWASMNLWLIMPLAWPFVFPSVDFDHGLFGINLVAATIFSMSHPLSIGALGEQKTHAALLISGAGLVIALATTLAFGVLAGLHGVAYGRAIGILFYTASFAVFTVRSTGIRYRWCSMLALLLSFFALVLGIQMLRIGPLWADLTAQMLVANLISVLAATVFMKRRGHGISLPFVRASEVRNG